MTAALYPADYGNVPMGGHCGVLATAIFGGRSFLVAWDSLKACQPRPGRWKGATNRLQRERVLRAWGVEFRSILHVTRNEYAFLKGRSMLACYDATLPRCSVATFARKYAKPGVTYMLRVRRHVVTLRDGIVIDQGRAAPADQHPEGKRLITHTLERL
ncbi:MAG: hypothetical protein C0511_09215 [Hyphomicrobium sp.]|nr:hypothetical protein [Hyphomicrobium sp.]